MYLNAVLNRACARRAGRGQADNYDAMRRSSTKRRAAARSMRSIGHPAWRDRRPLGCGYLSIGPAMARRKHPVKM